MVLLISYDLDNHERPSSYAAVRAVIERYAASARKPLYSGRLGRTRDRDRRRAHVRAGDDWSEPARRGGVAAGALYVRSRAF